MKNSGEKAAAACSLAMYVIDNSQPFDGSVLTRMQDGKHSDYTGETLSALKTIYKNRNLKKVSFPQIMQMVNQHSLALQKPFEEISEERYWELLCDVPPARTLKSTGNAFFMGEPYQYDLHLFCFRKADRFYCGLRSITTSEQTLLEEISQY